MFHDIIIYAMGHTIGWTEGRHGEVVVVTRADLPTFSNNGHVTRGTFPTR